MIWRHPFWSRAETGSVCFALLLSLSRAATTASAQVAPLLDPAAPASDPPGAAEGPDAGEPNELDAPEPEPRREPELQPGPEQELRQEPEPHPEPNPSAVAAPAQGQRALEVTVRSPPSTDRQRVKSSEAVSIVELREARKRSSDLGEVLSRVAGVSIRRSGGLGSDFRFSLNGLYGAQIRFFIDGVPIDRVYAVSLANIPVNLVQNVEIYRGVVPLRFGADALGGAVNLVTAQRYETSAKASYQVGSFGTHRVTAGGRYRHEPTGIVAGVDTFYDYAKNDYPIDVEVADDLGQLSPAHVKRFHDRYWGYGAAVEVGVVDKPWAKQLMLRGFTSQYEKQLQNSLRMTVPYGKPYYGETIRGGLLTYRNSFAHKFDLNVVGSYTHRTIDLVDKGDWQYDWRGNRLAPLRSPGEIEKNNPRDQSVWQRGTFGRAVLDARLYPGHTLTFTVTPDFVSRTGEQRLLPDPAARDELAARRHAFKQVSGIGYTLHLAPMARAPQARDARRADDYRVENTLFAKSYVYRVESAEILSGGVFTRRDQARNDFGAGDAVRVTLLDDYLLAKASYEFATRLPDSDEIFGDGVLTSQNLSLVPERGHNVNVGPQLDLRNTPLGSFWVDINGFFRDTRDQIVLFGRTIDYSYQNIYRARTLGIENSIRWQAPKRYLTLDGQITLMDQRNISGEGQFGKYKGERIPHRPWLFASWGGFVHFEGVLTRRDRIEPFYQGRFVDSYYFGWESVGRANPKATIPAQTSHTVGLTYGIDFGRSSLYATFDVQNLTNETLFDNFLVQRPGRAYYFKLTGEL